MTRLKRMLRIVMCLLFVLASWLCLSCTHVEAAEEVAVPIAQWNQLKLTLQEQELTLQQADRMLSQQKEKSVELQLQLEKSKVLLTEASTRLKTAEQDLTNAKLSLEEASNKIEQLKILCQQLKQDIAKERAMAKRGKIKTAIIFSVLGVALGAVIF